MAKLSMAQRKKLPSSSFARPGKGKGPSGKGTGSFPIPDIEHARKAIQLSGGAPDIRAKVKKKFPSVGKKK